jgi:hypothetical protein
VLTAHLGIFLSEIYFNGATWLCTLSNSSLIVVFATTKSFEHKIGFLVLLFGSFDQIEHVYLIGPLSLAGI